jgi:hypothetical protein
MLGVELFKQRFRMRIGQGGKCVEVVSDDDIVEPISSEPLPLQETKVC